MADDPKQGASAEPQYPEMSAAEFLEGHPPGSFVDIPDFHVLMTTGWEQHQPDLQLHCWECGGIRIFAKLERISIVTQATGLKYLYFRYRCRNCSGAYKTYAVMASHTSGDAGRMLKFGEFPAFGPPVPSKVISLVGPDRDLFLRGRRAENQGLGIGAFAYYRRVLENQWQRLLGEIASVCDRLGATDAAETLRQAKEETQFGKAVDMVKAAVPDSLKVNGYNPITLLHSALSEGLHAQPEEECLELAQSIRVVLTELADRIGQALKDEDELRTAVIKLANPKAKSSAKSSGSAPTKAP